MLVQLPDRSGDSSSCVRPRIFPPAPAAHKYFYQRRVLVGDGQAHAPSRAQARPVDRVEPVARVVRVAVQAAAIDRGRGRTQSQGSRQPAEAGSVRTRLLTWLAKKSERSEQRSSENEGGLLASWSAAARRRRAGRGCLRPREAHWPCTACSLRERGGGKHELIPCTACSMPAAEKKRRRGVGRGEVRADDDGGL